MAVNAGANQAAGDSHITLADIFSFVLPGRPVGTMVGYDVGNNLLKTDGLMGLLFGKKH